VSEARVPLAAAEDARVVGFRPADGSIEQFAIVIGTPAAHQPVLCRVHSECFTGDLLGSLRCDCGPQLEHALRLMGTAGHGVLLYLAHEGRGIGLINKLRAYQLQDQGLDTLDANQQLGFEPDERTYRSAAVMLRHLGIGRIRLLTNNPLKVEALAREGIDVVERVAHAITPNRHNHLYLATKARRAGHLLDG
jgi:GTP cyclohydrolase II